MSAYGSFKFENSHSDLQYLPIRFRLKDDTEIVLDCFKESDKEGLHSIVADTIAEGQTYPFEDLSNVYDFENYFLSQYCFVARRVTHGDVLGAFYVKQNFPGRSAHICNAGFVVRTDGRGKGLGKFMSTIYLRIARDLGFKASLFNLVYASNINAIHIYEKLGFKRVGTIPKAGYLRDIGVVDAHQYYFDLETWIIPPLN